MSISQEAQNFHTLHDSYRSFHVKRKLNETNLHKALFVTYLIVKPDKVYNVDDPYVKWLFKTYKI